MKKKSTRLAPTSCLWQQGFRGALQRLTMTLMLVMLTTMTAWADGLIIRGTCGDTNQNGGNDVTWKYNTETHILTISGEGAMANYSSADDNQPWKDFRDNIESLVIKKGVTSIGNYALADCNLQSITYEAGTQLTTIGNYALYGCYYLASAYIPSSVESIRDDAFAYCGSLKNVFVCPETPPTLGENVFVECGYNVKFTVRSNAYKTADGWKELGNVEVGDAANFNIPYIDADGNDAICPYAIPIPESDEAVLEDDYNFYCYNGDLWYYVSDNVNRANSLSFNQDDSFGTANIILSDNATLSVSNISSNANLSIYGQKNDEGKITGSITIENGSGSGIHAGKSITINGVTIEITGYDNGIYALDGDITINGGDISVTGATSYGIYSQSGDVTINSGEITASATGCGIFAGNDITLGDATITASSYETYGSFKIADGLILYDGSNTYSGTLTEEQIAALSAGTGLTLQKLPEYLDLIATIDWDDNDQSNMRPSSVTVSLMANGVKDEDFELIKSTETGEWNFTATLPSCLNNGTPIVYSWDMTDIPNGYVLTNTSKEGPVTTFTLTLQQCGGEVVWNYDASSKTLTISGTGAMDDYSPADDQPWKDFRDEIESVVIKKGVTSIGNFAFAECTNLESVKYEAESQLGTIGSNAFYSCYSLAAVYIPSSVETIGNNAFAGYRPQNVFVCPEDAPELGDNAFGEYYTSIDFIVRNRSYEEAEGWSAMADGMTVGDANNFDILYLDAEGNKFICPYSTPISQEENDYSGDDGDLWYYVSGYLTFDELSFGADYGTANIILRDGVNLTINSTLSTYTKISVWRQYDENPENTPGTIMAPGLSAYAIILNGVNFESSSDFQAGDGGLIINGGEINVNGVINSSGNITINESVIIVNEISSSSNITVNDGNITIQDGNIIASSDENPEGGTITINGGEITFDGNGGFNSNDIIINGSEITSGSFDVSDGGNSERGNITITNGVIDIASGDLQASNINITDSGIGITDGYINAPNLTINSGDINIANENDYGINCDDITIKDGTITVDNSLGGIYASNITIEGGEITVTATGDYSYGISAVESITINGGKITATATGENAKGIYAGSDITLGDATITASSYNIYGSFKIADGLFMTDLSKYYSGTLFDGNNTDNGKFETLEALNESLAGKTLQQVPDKIDLMATIVWNDNFDQYEKRPTSVNVKLMADGDKVDTYELTADENGEWKCTATDLPSLNEGELIDYSWKMIDQLDDYVLTSNTTEYTATTLTLSVTVPLFAANSSNLWMTWCDKNEYTKPEGVTVYTVSGVDDNTVLTSEVSGDVIPAYMPVLLYRSEAGSDAVKAVFNAVGTAPENGYDSNSGVVETAGSGNATFLGIPGDEAYAPGDNNNIFAISDFSNIQSYVLRNGNFVAVDEDSGIAPHRCWLNVTKNTTNNAPLLSICTGSETTGFIPVPSPKGEGSGYWYTLDGRKFDSKPTTKGLYIYNGKKHVIK